MYVLTVGSRRKENISETDVAQDSQSDNGWQTGRQTGEQQVTECNILHTFGGQRGKKWEKQLKFKWNSMR